MFFTAMVMLAGAGWYVMASNPAQPAKPAAEAKVIAPQKAPLMARRPAPIAAKTPTPE